MKLAKLFVLLIPVLALSACNNVTDETSTTKGPFIKESDGYQDVMPTDTGDGAILHCFNWSYQNILDNLDAIAESGYKSIQIMPVQTPKSGGAQWWAYYQPLSLSIAESSFLGTKAELKTVCQEAEKRGISVIADIVFNHLANVKEGELEADKTPKVSPDVEKYEPEIYQHRNDATNPTFHHIRPKSGPGSITQFYPYGDLPDLNTSHPLVQEKCLNLLKDCIDLGIDGFRFDAAKHIETPNDKEYASDFWPNTLGKAKEYYKQKTNKELFAYGEVLMEAGPSRPMSMYTDIMNVTDDSYIASKTGLVISGDMASVVDAKYGKDADPKKLVTWVESHDKYLDSDHHWDNDLVRLFWGFVAGRKDSRGLFFARPNEGKEVGPVGDYMFEDPIVAACNRFHNRFKGAEEYQVAQDAFYVNQRVGKDSAGAIIISPDYEKTFTTDKLVNLPDRMYFDQITGKAVEVRDGKATVEMDENGIAILTPTKNELRPSIELSSRGGAFAGEKTVTVNLKNVTKASYTINDSEPINIEGETIDIKFGGEGDDRENIIIKVSAENSQFKITRKAEFKKVALVEGGFNVSNFNLDNLENYEVYLWKWNDTTGESSWSKDYTFKGNTMLVDVTGLDGFLIGLFPKGYTIANLEEWDDKCVKQSSDIKGEVLTQGFFDATGF